MHSIIVAFVVALTVPIPTFCMHAFVLASSRLALRGGSTRRPIYRPMPRGSILGHPRRSVSQPNALDSGRTPRAEPLACPRRYRGILRSDRWPSAARHRLAQPRPVCGPSLRESSARRAAAVPTTRGVHACMYPGCLGTVQMLSARGGRCMHSLINACNQSCMVASIHQCLLAIARACVDACERAWAAACTHTPVRALTALKTLPPQNLFSPP